MKPRKRKSHFHVVADILPGERREVHMMIDAERPPWITFRIKGQRRKFAMPLSTFVSLGLRRAQVRYAEAVLGTEGKNGMEGTDAAGTVRDAPVAG